MPSSPYNEGVTALPSPPSLQTMSEADILRSRYAHIVPSTTDVKLMAIPGEEDFDLDHAVKSHQSHNRKKTESRISRPRNSFMMFRSAFVKKAKQFVSSIDCKEISRIVGLIWNSLDEGGKAPWENLARSEKERHKLLYPEYSYSPQTSRRSGVLLSKPKVKKNPTLKAKAKKAGARTRRATDGDDDDPDDLDGEDGDDDYKGPVVIPTPPLPSPAIRGHTPHLPRPSYPPSGRRRSLSESHLPPNHTGAAIPHIPSASPPGFLRRKAAINARAHIRSQSAQFNDNDPAPPPIRTSARGTSRRRTPEGSLAVAHLPSAPPIPSPCPPRSDETGLEMGDHVVIKGNGIDEVTEMSSLQAFIDEERVGQSPLTCSNEVDEHYSFGAVSPSFIHPPLSSPPASDVSSPLQSYSPLPHFDRSATPSPSPSPSPCGSGHAAHPADAFINNALMTPDVASSPDTNFDYPSLRRPSYLPEFRISSSGSSYQDITNSGLLGDDNMYASADIYDITIQQALMGASFSHPLDQFNTLATISGPALSNGISGQISYSSINPNYIYGTFCDVNATAEAMHAVRGTDEAHANALQMGVPWNIGDDLAFGSTEEVVMDDYVDYTGGFGSKGKGKAITVDEQADVARAAGGHESIMWYDGAIQDMSDDSDLD